MRLTLATIICFASSHVCFAQSNFQLNQDSIGKTKYDSSFKLFSVRHEIPPQRFPAKALVGPAAMVAFGFLATRMDATLDLNEHIRKEIWTESPHKLQHIDNYLVFAPAVAVYGLNIAGVKGKNNMLDRSMIYVMSSVISNAAAFGLKSITHEQRPDGTDYYSFPSGHTAQAFVSAEFLRQEYKDVSPWYGIAGYGVATGVGILRMYNNKHWLNDVVAGAGFGIASTRLAYWLYPKIKNTFSKNKPLNTMIMPSYNQGSYGISLVHFFK